MAHPITCGVTTDSLTAGATSKIELELGVAMSEVAALHAAFAGETVAIDRAVAAKIKIMRLGIFNFMPP